MAVPSLGWVAILNNCFLSGTLKVCCRERGESWSMACSKRGKIEMEFSSVFAFTTGRTVFRSSLVIDVDFCCVASSTFFLDMRSLSVHSLCP